ncbi:MAG: DUF3187 family protein [Verrucomicrobiota bacterium]
MGKLITDSRKLWFGIIIISAVSMVYAEQASPIYVANQNPFVQIFGLPKAEPGTITPKGRLDAGFLYFVSNNAIESESIIWDGETAQYNFRFRYGVSDKLELGVDVPFIEHGGGYLDSIIRNYHKMMGFPNDRQEQFEKNQIKYQLGEDTDPDYLMEEGHSGLGDIRVSAAIPLFEESLHAQRHLALRSLLKLPTGDSKYLFGSGGTDLSVGLAYSDYQTLGRLNTVLAAHFGMIYMGDAEVLRDQQRHFAGYGGVSLDWLTLDWLEFKLQMDMHSAFYHSELKQLGSSIQLLAGGTVHLPGEVLLDLGISEQLITDATPDVGFYLLARHLF